MKGLFLIIVFTTIMWSLIDWMKPYWEKLSFARYISIGVAVVFAVAFTITFNLDMLVAFEVATENTIIGGVSTALAMTAGSNFINSLVKKVQSSKTSV